MKKLFLTLLLALIGVGSMMADEPFRKHRYDSWKVMDLPENAIVFAGNSITDMHNWTEAFANDPRVVNRGNSGGYSYEVLDNVETWVRFKPAKVFIKIGTNDLGTNYTEQSIAKNIQRTVDIIRRESPNTEIYLQSILPAKNQNYKTPATIAATNLLIKAIADKDEKVTYVDLNSKLTGITSGQPYSLDNLHLEAYGYKVWCDAIQEYVGTNHIYPDNTNTIQNTGTLGSAHGMRATYFSVQPTKSTDILFFGDEMVKNGEWQELLHNQNVKNRGTGWGYGGDIATTSKLIDASFANANNNILREKPAKILLYTGTGDINGNTAIETVESNYEALITKLKQNAPNVPIGLVSLMPTQGANARITTFNSWLASKAQSDAQLTYIDIYTDLAQSSGAAKTAYFSGNYIYGMGYIQVARKLADFIGNCRVITDAEAENLKNVSDARASLQKNIFAAEDAPEGNGMGQYTSEIKAPANASAESARNLLLDANTTIEQLQAAASDIQEKVNAMKSSINLPTEATTTGKFFTIRTPNRGNRYLTNNGEGKDMTGVAWNGKDNQVWKLQWRSDNTFDVVSVNDGSFMTTTSPITTSATAPATGWTFGDCNSLGLFIITSGTNQLNQQNNGEFKILNWGDGTTKGDDGCNYAITEISENDYQHIDLKPLLEDGKTYTIEGYVKAANSRRFITYNGTTRSLEATATNDDTQKWTAHASGNKFYFESVAAPGNYLKFDGNANGVATDATSANVLFTVSAGTTGEALSLQGTHVTAGAKYMASSTDGTKLGDFYASATVADYTTSGVRWSTDFIFTEVSKQPVKDLTGVSATKVTELSGITDGYYLVRDWNSVNNQEARRGYIYMNENGALLVNTTDRNKTASDILTNMDYSADYFWKITKNGEQYTIAAANASGNFWPSMNSNGRMSVSPTAANYTITAHTDGNGTFQFQTNNVYVNADPGFLSTWSNGHAIELYRIEGAETETVTLTYQDTEAGKQETVDVEMPSVRYPSNITINSNKPEFCEIISVNGTTINVSFLEGEKEYTITSNNFTNYRGGSEATSGGNFASESRSNTSPTLIFKTTNNTNNLQWSGTNLAIYPGSGGSHTFTLQAPAGYIIESYSFTATNISGNTDNMTLTIGDKVYTTTTAQHISAPICGEPSVAIIEKGSNKGVVLSDFIVKIKKDLPEMPKMSTNEEQHWYYITNAASNTNAAYAKDKVIYYNSGDDRIKFGNKTFDPQHVWSFWENNGKVAIKNYAGDYFGTPANGTGGSTAFGKMDEANYVYTIAAAHGFFTITAGTGAPLHAQNDGSVIVRWGAEEGNASLWRFNEVDCSDPSLKVNSTIVQQGRVTTGIGNKNLPILRSTLNVSGLTGSINFEGVSGTITGTGAASVEKVKIYFATNERELVVEEDATSWRDANAELIGEATIADGNFSLNATTAKQLTPGSNYLWIVYDIAADAVEGTTVDATITGYTVGGNQIAEQNGNPAHAATIFLSEGTVLMPKDKGVDKVNGSIYYRIPAITTVLKNGQTRLVTLTDDRRNHGADLPSHCYIVAQHSDDLGKTWSEPICVAGTAETGGDYGHGDASIVTNRNTGRITGIMTTSANGNGFFGSTVDKPQTWKTIHSDDGGETWTVPVDHTKNLYAAGSPNPTWKGGFSGSGAALQKRDGTLVSSFVNRELDNSQHFYFFMSEDDGENWKVVGTSGTTGADEPKTLERNNGDLAISVRAGGYNFHNVTSDNGATWKYAPQTRFTSGISGNACDGEYMVWCSSLEGNEVAPGVGDIAFQTCPNNGSRQNVSIALSTDEGETFGTPKTICPSGSAYSAATVLPDGTLGVYYEENGVYGTYTMRFVRFSLDWASNNAYTFKNNPFKPIPSTYTGIDDVDQKAAGSKKVVSTEYFNIAGQRIAQPNGICIVRKHMADGKVVNSKMNFK
ncbi:MAG: exo-alpha-sialidase [Bacteroidales bacterium]|nr:exo-alpha-sialidase [Candidatus Physcousia equi]